MAAQGAKGAKTSLTQEILADVLINGDNVPKYEENPNMDPREKRGSIKTHAKCKLFDQIAPRLPQDPKEPREAPREPPESSQTPPRCPPDT